MRRSCQLNRKARAMNPTDPRPDAFVSERKITTPSGAPRAGQPAWNTQRGSAMPMHRYRSFADEVEPIRLPDRSWPEQRHHARADVVRGRPARRQPGADRSDEPGPQATHVRPAGPDGLQGDRGRLPVGQPDRFRLRPRDHRRGRDPRRRHHPGADAVSPRADRAHLRGVPRVRHGPSCTSTTRPRSCSAGWCSGPTATR